ncbi:hypothetical protein HMPREF9413_1503 [Paenibacillus sp. HGF7]|nr:hypothetical protein HMPREF9413_1503 [Paenibacillus sp. HGF7]
MLNVIKMLNKSIFTAHFALSLIIIEVLKTIQLTPEKTILILV